jgi:hypothetical protein
MMFKLLSKRDSNKRSSSKKEDKRKNSSVLAGFRPMSSPTSPEEKDPPKPSFTMQNAVAGAAAAANAFGPLTTAAEDACLLFEDEEDDGDNSGEHAAPPVQLLSPPRLSAATMSTQVPAGSFFAMGLPSEVMIDHDAVPPSPMRDSSISSPARRTSPPDDLLHTYRSSSPPAEFGAPVGDIGMRTQLWDAQRLVRVILGRTTDKPLETGSILSAIRAFAVMKQELIGLRQKQEQQDNDPPAILTDLTSPATTRNSSLSTPRTRSLTPQQQHPTPEDFSTRSALIETAKKMQLLERQLQEATVTIQQLQQQKEWDSGLQEQRLSQLHAENQSLKEKLVANNRSQHASGGKAVIEAKEEATSPTDLEDILAKLHSIPAKTVSAGERQRIRQYVVDMLQQTHSSLHQRELRNSQEREHLAQVELKRTKEQLEELQRREKPSQAFQQHLSELETEMMSITDPSVQARDELQQKDNRIAQLEDSQQRLQTILKSIVANKPLQDIHSSPPPNQSNNNHNQRLQILHEEHQALMATIQVLEEEVKLGT